MYPSTLHKGILWTSCGFGAMDVNHLDFEWGRVVLWMKIRCCFYTKEKWTLGQRTIRCTPREKCHYTKANRVIPNVSFCRSSSTQFKCTQLRSIQSNNIGLLNRPKGMFVWCMFGCVPGGWVRRHYQNQNKNKKEKGQKRAVLQKSETILTLNWQL